MAALKKLLSHFKRLFKRLLQKPLYFHVSTVLALATGMDPTKVDSYEFGCKLTYSLVQPYIQYRSTNGLQRPILKNIELNTGISEVSSNAGVATHTNIKICFILNLIGKRFLFCFFDNFFSRVLKETLF